MNPEALLHELKRDPYIPIRLHVSDGRAVDITDPQSAVIANLAVYVFKIRRNERNIADDTQLVSLRHIVSVEQLATSSNGH